jgi:hypothetical protein
MYSYLHAEYAEPVDMTGNDLIMLLDAPKEALRKSIPTLRDTSAMTTRQGTAPEVTTRDTGEIADEIHDFLNGRFADYKLERIMLKRGRIISIIIVPFTPPARAA